MSKKEESLDTVLARAVKSVYFNRAGNNFNFVASPYFDERLFSECFAVVIHRYGIFYHRSSMSLTQEQQDDRRRYVLHYRTIRRRLMRAIGSLAKNESRRKAKNNSPSPPPLREDARQPEQLWLRGFQPVSTIPPHVAQRLCQLRKSTG